MGTERKSQVILEVHTMEWLMFSQRSAVYLVPSFRFFCYP